MKIIDLQGKTLFECQSDTLKETLVEAVKQGADLQGANLQGADLQGADLRGAYLRWAYLQRADLQGANLQRADLQRADLQGANLQGADLRGAYLRGADLRGANLRGADLRGAVEADYAIAQTHILPEGDLIGYKKLRGGVIAKLLIPKDAKRSHAFGRKCRAEYAVVLELQGAITEPCYSHHDSTFEYHTGATIKPTEPFDDDWTQECSTGIHFFITRIEAERY